MPSKQIYDYPQLLDEPPLLDLSQAARCFPVKCSRATIERWIRQGTRGIRLETILVGNRRFTTEQAIQRFLVNQQYTEPEMDESIIQKYSRMSKKAIIEASRKYNLPEPLNQN